MGRACSGLCCLDTRLHRCLAGALDWSRLQPLRVLGKNAWQSRLMAPTRVRKKPFLGVHPDLSGPLGACAV